MKVIKVGNCRVEAAYCNLRCPYCTHLETRSTDMSVDEIVSELDGCETVYIGGAEPTIHRDLKDLVEKLAEKSVKVTLKTSGFNPKAVEEVLSFVNMVVLEIKGDFDDLKKLSILIGLNEERTKKYLENFFKTLEAVRKSGKKIRIWARMIENYLDAETLERLMSRIGKVDEVLVYQYLSKPEWDKKVEYLSPPSFEEVVKAGKVAKKFAGKVIVVAGGRRFEID